MTALPVAPPRPDVVPRGGEERSPWRRYETPAVVAAVGTLALAGVLHVLWYGRNIPLAEDWHLVPPLTGEEPSFWSWVWSQNNEHRLPLARLVHLGLLELTGDFRAGAIFSTLLTASVAAGLVLVARRVRGRTSIVDAVFPVLLLHPGNWENLFWSWQMQFVIVGALTLGLLALLVASPLPPTRGVAWLAGALLVLLPLGGGTALPFVPFAIAAVLCLVLDPRTSPSARRVAVIASAVCVAEVGLYFVGWQAATWYPDNPGPRETIETAGRVLAFGWGPALEGRVLPLLLLTAVVLVPTVALVVRTAVQPGPQRRRATVLGCLLVGGASTVAAVAYGRAALVPAEGLADRYVILSVPVLIAAWFVVQCLGAPGVRRLVQGTLLVGALLLLPVNWSKGYSWRDWYVGGMEAVERDLSAGVTPEVLAARHGEFLMHWDEQELVRRIELLRRRGDGPLAGLAAAD